MREISNIDYFFEHLRLLIIVNLIEEGNSFWKSYSKWGKIFLAQYKSDYV